MSANNRTEKKEDAVVTAYENYSPDKQGQNLPGLDTEMAPLAEHLKVEKWNNDGAPYLEEYRGTGKLDGKARIVTGGDSGIGRSVALFFAREGANVTIAYLPEEEEDAKQVAKLVSEAPMGSTEILCLPLDLMKEEDCRSLVDKHRQKWGTLDVLVNNASKQVMCENFEEVDLQAAESVFRSNILGAVRNLSNPHPHNERSWS